MPKLNYTIRIAIAGKKTHRLTMRNLSHTIRLAIAGKRNHDNLAKLETDGRIEKILGVLNDMHNKLLNKTLSDPPSKKENDIYNDIAPGSVLKAQFLSGLADGADQLVTSKVDSFHYSNDNGNRLRPWIDAVLPFTKDRYRNHPLYPLDNTKRFDSLMLRADRRIYVNNDCVSDKLCTGTKEEIGHAANRAYEAQALLMLRRCDVLLAITGPEEPVKQAGTMHTINKARAYHIPVIFVSLADDKIYILNDDSTSFETVEMLISRGQVKAADNDSLEELFKELLSQQTPKSVEGIKVEFEGLIFEDDYKNPNSRKYFVRKRKEIWARINKKMGENADRKIEQGNICKKAETKLTEDEQTEVRNFHNNIEKVNSDFSNQYRGGFILNNLLAVIAVTIAVFMLLILIYSHLFHVSQAFIFIISMVILIVTIQAG